MTFQFRGTHPCGYEGSGYGANRAAYNKIQLDSQFSQRVAGELLFRQPQGHVTLLRSVAGLSRIALVVTDF